MHELGLEDFPQPTKPPCDYLKPVYNPKRPSKNQFTKPFYRDKDPPNRQNPIQYPCLDSFKYTIDDNYPIPAYKTSYNSNPFPKVIPDNNSNSYADDCTQFTSNNYRNKPEELLSTYWGNHNEEPPKLYDSPIKPFNKFCDYERFERKSNFFLPAFEKPLEEKYKREDPAMKFHGPNKFHFNPDGPYMFSTPQNYKDRIKYEPDQNFGQYHSTNLGYFKKNNNSFSEFFNSNRKFHSQRDTNTNEEFSADYNREMTDFSLGEMSYDDNISRNIRGI